jgi:hypothetical protein
MIAHELLLKKIEEAIKIASDLSSLHEEDQYTEAVVALMIANDHLSRIDLDCSSICQCRCHIGKSLHCAPCSCYRGSPK